ncbi:YARHG domain-containing protein [Pseudobutyrivibrio xylanivorans]|uniref:YARHG domain-containing protein n=1 Tax=Pseudobutyrivibrio xylanivorans TaxID=185007 RepID=A0A5P6VQH0_PSEXY|nr:YARHG domain-containing protein [Pseudobutyrivibrio xylanivorans]
MLKLKTYMEQVRECTDIAVYCYPIYDTDKRYYEASDFSDDPWIIINIAKNEIYARHGYIFTDPDLYDFFMGQLWYVPTVEAEDFDDSVFNEYERANLQLVSQLDKH